VRRYAVARPPILGNAQRGVLIATPIVHTVLTDVVNARIGPIERVVHVSDRTLLRQWIERNRGKRFRPVDHVHVSADERQDK